MHQKFLSVKITIFLTIACLALTARISAQTDGLEPPSAMQDVFMQVARRILINAEKEASEVAISQFAQKTVLA
jgi:hypothetical protein